MTNEDIASLYESTRKQLFGFCIRKLPNRELAEDIVQEAYLKFVTYVRSNKEVKEITAPKSYLFRILLNLITDYYRKRRDVSLDEILENDAKFFVSESSAEDMITETELSLVGLELENLSPPFKEILTMRFVDGFRPKEIARLLGTNQNMVSVRINRAQKMLRNIYQKKVKQQP